MSRVQPELCEPIDSETLFRRYAQFVASFLYRLGVREADLDDTVQEVFMVAHRKGGYRPGAASPTTFLARLALEACSAFKRRNQRFRNAHEVAPGTLTSSDPATPERELALQQAAQCFQAALDRLDPETRAMFLLFELEGESCDAIASSFGLKLGTVYSRLHGARTAFHAHVASMERCDRPSQGATQGVNRGPRTQAFARK